MSKAFKKLAFLDPVANTVVSGSVKGLVDPTASIKSEKEAAAAKDAAAQSAATAALAKETGASVTGISRAKELNARTQDIKSQAVAAGAARTENEADTLGVADPRAAKRKSASRALLG